MRPENVRLRRTRIAAAAWGIVLFGITSYPNPPEVPGVFAIPESDKLTHVWLYAVEAFLLYRAVAWPGRPGGSLSRVIAIVGTLAVWGTVDEVHQAWIPGREMDGTDLIADVAGGFLGAASAALASRAAARKLERESPRTPLIS